MITDDQILKLINSVAETSASVKVTSNDVDHLTQNIKELSELVKTNVCTLEKCSNMERRIALTEKEIANFKDMPNKILWRMVMVVAGALALAFVSQYTSSASELKELQQYQAVQYQALKKAGIVK